MKAQKFLAVIISIFALVAFLAGPSTAQALQTGDTLKCKGTTIKGLACNSTWITNGYCRSHNPDRITCLGITAKGEQCKSIVSHTGDLCHVHSKLTGEELTTFPNYKQADSKFGQDSRFSDQWCELAAKQEATASSRPRFGEVKK